VSTSNYDPEFGNAGGAATTVAMKSRGSAFHGSLFEYNYTNALRDSTVRDHQASMCLQPIRGEPSAGASSKTNCFSLAVIKAADNTLEL
jgi:hypothetical protein